MATTKGTAMVRGCAEKTVWKLLSMPHNIWECIFSGLGCRKISSNLIEDNKAADSGPSQSEIELRSIPDPQELLNSLGVDDTNCTVKPVWSTNFRKKYLSERRMTGPKCKLKMILLGTSNSGKSTFFKQMRILHADGFSVEERHAYGQSIRNNLLETTHVLIQNLDEETRLIHAQDIEEFLELVSLKNDSLFTSTVTRHRLRDIICNLSTDVKVKDSFTKYPSYQISENFEYFFKNCNRIMASDYEPTDEDVVNTRTNTTAVVDLTFNVSKNEIQIIDVGGQRSQRAKWLSLFEGDLAGMLFFAALSGYCKVILEDGKTNALKESLSLFYVLLNQTALKSVNHFVFLNKVDLFYERLQTVPLTYCFPEYTGKPNDYDDAINYIWLLFVKLQGKVTQRSGDSSCDIEDFEEETRDHFPTSGTAKRATEASPKLYIHEACSTDVHITKRISDSVFDAVLQQTLRSVFIT